MKNWKGRIDGSKPEELRWHQIVQNTENVDNFEQDFVIIGFESDEGVKRNQGRAGAKEAPAVLRQVMSNFPVHDLRVIYDAGDIVCENNDLEKAQKELIAQLQNIYQKGGKSLILGGGHEVTYPHYLGLKKSFPHSKIGILNFDAHFDNRKLPENGNSTSGTGFYEISNQEEMHSLHIGIQLNSNTKSLFDYAHEKGMQYILASDFYTEKELSQTLIQNFIASIDLLYVTICMDVFSAAFAPGVSATAYNGMIPDAYFNEVFQSIISNEKLMAMDLAEVNPSLDIDNRTAKLACSFIFEAFQVS